MKVVPMGDSVVVRKLPAEPTTAEGIVLPDAGQQGPIEGRVVSVGDGLLLATGQRVGHQVSEGDRVLFDRDAGTEVTVDGEPLLILREDEILAVVNPSK